MRNKTSNSKRNTAPQQQISKTSISDICLITCPIFKKELESILAELNLTPTISYMHYTIHTNPLIMEEQLQENISVIQEKDKNIRFLVGMHCKGLREMAEVVESCQGKIPQEKNCIEILLGDELSKDLQENRTSLMTPAWVRMITQSIAEGQWSVSEARLNLGWYNKILILDTGVDMLSDEEIMEFFDLTQVEIDILPVDLNHFRTVLADLLQ